MKDINEFLENIGFTKQYDYLAGLCYGSPEQHSFERVLTNNDLTHRTVFEVDLNERPRTERIFKPLFTVIAHIKHCYIRCNANNVGEKVVTPLEIEMFMNKYRHLQSTICKSIINEYGDWVVIQEGVGYTCNTPQLYPMTMTLEALKESYSKFGHNIDFDKYKEVEVEIRIKQ